MLTGTTAEDGAMPGYTVGPAGDDLAEVAAIFAAVGFRAGLVDDLATVRSLGGAIFLASAADDKLAGVSSTLPFGATGWIGGVAVHPAHQRQGLGERLTRLAVRSLQQQGAQTVLLHSTPMAASLYTGIGFEPVAEYAEYAGAPTGGQTFPPPGVRPGVDSDLAEVSALDRWATGEDRSRLLRSLWPASGWVPEGGAGQGFLLRQSPTAAGAVVVADVQTGDLLLAAALSDAFPGSTAGPGFRVPVAVDHPHVTEFLGQRGFVEKSRTTRMRLGPPVEARPEKVFSAFNLYWG